MAIGFPASSSWSRTFNVDATLLRQLVRRAIERLEWSFESTGTGTFIARIPANMNSWGEIVTVTVDDAGTVDAESRCAWPAQIFDWGKNRSNLNEFHAALLRAIRNSELDPASPSRSDDDDGATPLERAIRSSDTDPE
jgi:hypothetical protein